MRVRREEIGCTQSQIPANILDEIVWNAIMDMLTVPEMLSEALDMYYADTGMQQVRSRLEQIKQQLADREKEDEKLYRAYMSGAFDADEFAGKRQGIRDAVSALREEKTALSSQITSQEEVREKRQMVAGFVEEMRTCLLTLDVPFETRRRIMKMLVDEIELNVNDGWLGIKGVLTGTSSLRGGDFANTPADMGSSRRSS